MTELRLDVELSHPRGRVWRALTDPELLNRWFQPMEDGYVTPTDELPSFGPFEMETVVSDPPLRLVWRWHGEDFSSEVEWTLTKVGDRCRLALRQTGLLGTREVCRRDELFSVYRTMLHRRLPTVLARLAAGDPDVDRLTPRTAAEPESDQSRVRLLSFLGAVVLVVLCASAAAVWITGGSGSPLGGGASSGSELGAGSQPGSSAAEVGSPSPEASKRGGPSSPTSPAGPPPPTSGSPPRPPGSSVGESATASYRTIRLLGLGGFDTEVTVRGENGTKWTVVLVMPDDTAVLNRSPETVKVSQDGKNVTVTPVSDSGGDAVFTVRFPALLALGKSIRECTIDGQPCSGS